MDLKANRRSEHTQLSHDNDINIMPFESNTRSVAKLVNISDKPKKKKSDNIFTSAETHKNIWNHSSQYQYCIKRAHLGFIQKRHN